MASAVQYLSGSLTTKSFETTSHRTIIVSGWDYNQSAKHAIAVYLVGLRACAVDAALNIRAQIEDTTRDRNELITNVLSIVGKHNRSLTPQQKQDERNPWIAEGIWHLCMLISTNRPEIHPLGLVIALNYPHVSTKDHGVDVVTIYETKMSFGLSIIESKAYKLDPNGAISSAVEFFRAVDRDEHALRIRQTIQIMRTSLSKGLQNRISGSFWERQRAYLPNPHYDSNCRINWKNTRPSLKSLSPGKENIIIMPHIITNFDHFFNQIADEMRSVVQGL